MELLLSMCDTPLVEVYYVTVTGCSSSGVVVSPFSHLAILRLSCEADDNGNAMLPFTI